MHATPIMSLHYLVKHECQKTNNIVQSLIVTSSVMGQFKKKSTARKLTVNCSMQLNILTI